MLLNNNAVEGFELSCKQRSKPAVSCTVTVNEQLDPDVVLQFTVVVPSGKNEPEAGLQATVPQAPLVAGAAKATMAPCWFGVFPTVKLEGQVMVQAAGVVVKVSLVPDAIPSV